MMWLLRRSSKPLTLTEIARGIRVAPSTAHSIIGELIDQGALLQNSSRQYYLGPAMFYLGAGYHHNVSFYARGWNFLVELADSTALSGVTAVVWEDHHLILDVHKNPHPGLEISFGGRVPLDAGAWGKAYYAWSGKVPAQLNTYTDKSISDLDQYNAELTKIRERGYATDRDEFLSGAGAISSGITSSGGFEGVIALIGSLADRSDEEISNAGQRLAELASTLSYGLGDLKRVQVLGGELGEPAMPGHGK
jgi:DNA-binding IclR family transcriptional regulator